LPDLYVRAVRGAVTVNENTPAAIREATGELLEEMADANQLAPDNMISIIFTVTPDLNAAFPAEAARLLDWNQVSLLCTTEIPVPGALKMCIRVLLHAYTPLDRSQIQHVYLGGAVRLRPDLESGQEQKNN
jgi:chorismate mutase